jgi:hypothetical protein
MTTVMRVQSFVWMAMILFHFKEKTENTSIEAQENRDL